MKVLVVNSGSSSLKYQLIDTVTEAVMAKLKTVTIIHGKGTGALRQAVQKELKQNRYVKNYRIGRYGEGEMGVTVVELK